MNIDPEIYLKILEAIAPVFLVMLVGFVLRSGKILTEETDKALMKLAINVLYPALILKFTLGNAALREGGNLFFAPLVGFVTVAVGFLVCLLVGWLAGLRKGGGLRAFAFVDGVYNYGYIPIPLITFYFAVQTPEGLEEPVSTLGVLLVHNVGVELAVWSVGIIIISGVGISQSWRKLINAPVITLVFAITLNFIERGMGKAPGTTVVPDFLLLFIEMLGRCAIPVGLLLCGAVIGDLIGGTKWFKGWKVPILACALRLGVLPVLFLLLARHLPVSVELKRVICIQAAMPSGVFPVVIAKHYGADTSTALQVVIATTIISVPLIPFWLTFGLEFAGIP